MIEYMGFAALSMHFALWRHQLCMIHQLTKAFFSVLTLHKVASNMYVMSRLFRPKGKRERFVNAVKAYVRSSTSFCIGRALMN